MMEQERIMEIAEIEREAREIEENLQMVDAQIRELESFKITVDSIMKLKSKEMLASIGSRVYLKAQIEDSEKLFVEVGAGVIVKKSPEETLDIVKGQISRLKEARLQMHTQLQENYRELRGFIEEVNGQRS